jgi:hypothetical protein
MSATLAQDAPTGLCRDGANSAVTSVRTELLVAERAYVATTSIGSGGGGRRTLTSQVSAADTPGRFNAADSMRPIQCG